MRRLLIGVLLIGIAIQAQANLRNSQYTLELAADDVVVAKVSGMPPQRIRGEFTVLWSETDPSAKRDASHPGYAIAPRVAVRWRNPANPSRLSDFVSPFSVGHRVVMKPVRVWAEANRIRWEYDTTREFTLAAELRLPEGKGAPLVRFTLTPKRDAFFSVAFTGAPDAALPDTVHVPQECDARGHKQFDFVMSEADLHLPRAHVATSDGNIALIADPQECRFRLPTFADSRFGFMLSSEGGRLKPVLLAPLLGGAESKMSAGKSWGFTFQCALRAGDWKDTFAHIARDVHGVRDQRDNSGPGSLNDCLARVMDFLADRRGGNRAMWDPQQKYFDYFTDKTGVFKPFSPLYGLGAAIVTDDEEFFVKRARPSVEYALSRRSLIFAPYDNSDNKQANSAQRKVGAPCIGVAQLSSLNELFQGRTPCLAAIAPLDGTKRMPLISSEEGFFDLLDRASETHDAKDIAAAREAAYYNAAKLNLYPAPPDETMTVDHGGRVPIHLHSFGRHKNQWGFPVPQSVHVSEQTVPAWRIARLGLPGIAYPIEYWMNTHGAMMRTAHLAHDEFLRDIARWGMVGRFGNFPGDNRSLPSLVPELPDTVERAPWEWNFATVNAGHAWDFAGAVLDFLVSDTFERSHGAVDFPAVSAAGSSFRVRIYGAKSGRFYDDERVHLWLPRGLVSSDNQQIDWLAAHGNGQLYLTLVNQSFRDESASVTLDRALAECRDGHARCWRNNMPFQPQVIENNAFRVAVPAKGIIALAIPATVKPRLQAKLYDAESTALPKQSFTTVATSFGSVHATLLRAGRELTSAFIYTEALPEDVITARLRWRQGDGTWQKMEDDVYPYEFSPEIRDEAGNFEALFEIEDVNQQWHRSPVITLAVNTSSKPLPTTASPSSETLKTQKSALSDLTSSSPPILTDEFIAYLQHAANGDNFGFCADGRFYPYSTPQGRRIAWRQPVWDKRFFAEGCTREEADRQLRAELSRTVSELTTVLAKRQPAIEFEKLDRRQQETLLDLALSEGVGGLQSKFVAAVLAGDWNQLVKQHLYVRYAGHVPDHSRNKAFAARWMVP